VKASSEQSRIMSSEKFCLRWNDFESNISVAFRELRDDKDFFDVTLACDDEQISAHKVILSACSPFFRNVLRRNPHQHPLLYLKGVKYTDLQSVLNFMYNGEVNVAQEELNSFLAVAEELRVKGLTQNQGGSQNRSKSPVIKPAQRQPVEREQAILPKRPKITPSTHNSFLQDDDDIQEVVPVKTEPRDPLPTQPQPMPSSYSPSIPTPSPSHAPPPSQSHAVAPMEDSLAQYEEQYEDYGHYEDQSYGGLDTNMAGAEGNKGSVSRTTSLEELDKQISAMMRKTVDPFGTKCWECLNCGKTCVGKNDIARHVESTHIDSPGIRCNICGKVSKTRNALRNHVYSVHNTHLMGN